MTADVVLYTEIYASHAGLAVVGPIINRHSGLKKQLKSILLRHGIPHIDLVRTYLGKRVFDLVKDFGTSESPKSTRSSTTHWCPGRPGHPAFRHNIASSLRLHTGLPYDWTPRSDAPLGSPLAPSARRVSRVASRLPGTTRLRFALHGGQRLSILLKGTLIEVPRG